VYLLVYKYLIKDRFKESELEVKKRRVREKIHYTLLK